MGGIVIKIEGFDETLEWNAHSLTVAKFLSMGNPCDENDLIQLIHEGQGDRHDGTITFDPDTRRIILNTDYFKIPASALKFWRAIGFDVIFKRTRHVK